MFYAGSSPSWDNKGVAFYSADSGGETIMRFYRITYGQLRDIQKQEGNSANWYGRMTFIDFIEGIPAFTLTSETIKRECTPSERYLNVVLTA